MTEHTTGAPVPYDWPDYTISFGGAVKRAFRKYIDFNGRASRREFWFFYLFYFVVAIVLVGLGIGLLLGTSPDGGQTPGVAGVPFLVLYGVFVLGVILPTLALACRRLHDAGFTGFFLLLGLITGLIPLIMCAFPTSPKGSVYGPPGQPPVPGPYGQNPYGQNPYGQPSAQGQVAGGHAPATDPYGAPQPPQPGYESQAYPTQDYQPPTYPPVPSGDSSIVQPPTGYQSPSGSTGYGTPPEQPSVRPDAPSDEGPSRS